MPIITTEYNKELEFEFHEVDDTIKIVATEKDGDFRTFAYYKKGRKTADAITSIDQEYKRYLNGIYL